MQSSTLSQELTFALDICEQVGEVVMHYFLKGVQTVAKSDGSPVTKADKESEHLVREALAQRYPGDDILGEEEGESFGANASVSLEKNEEPAEQSAARSRAKRSVYTAEEARDAADGAIMKNKEIKRRWIVDPIDGTYGFARGVPIFSTLLALEEEGEIRLGVVHAPAMSETYWAEKGHGAFRNGKRIRVSDCAEMSLAQFNFGCPNRILSLGYWEGFTKLIEKTYRQRGLGDYLSFAHVFDGRAEAHMEVGVSPWDLAPMKILVEEAGGIYSDLKGGRSIYTGSCLVSNAHLHDQFLNTLLSATST